MPRFTLKQLRVFVAIVRLGSITAAAKQLFMSQSAVSMALADLERALGKPLFERFHKTLRLNPIGEALFPKAITILEQAQALTILGDEAELRGTMKIAASSTIGNYLLPPYFNQFQHQHPQVKIVSRIANTETIIQSLLAYNTDVGFIEGYCHEAELITHTWLADELYVCASPSHPLATQTSINDTDLMAATWILREQGSGTREIFEHALSGRIAELKVVMELSSSEAIKAVLRHSSSLGCLSRHVIQDDLDKGSLIRLPVHLTLTRHFSWLVPPQRMTSPLVHAWFKLLKT